MKFERTQLDGVHLVALEPKHDERGLFARTYCEAEFAANGLNTRWPQCNLTRTELRGAVRGLHFQAAPRPEIKLVRCTAGAIFDVVVDVRPQSPTFGRWQGFELRAEDGTALYIDAGFAHGFQCLAERCELLYMMGDSYVAELARGVRWNDPTIGVQWPLEPTLISQRDRELPLLVDLFRQ